MDSDVAIVADNIGFSAKELADIKRIAEGNIEKIKEAWDDFFKGKC